jgi:hypothetical protein
MTITIYGCRIFGGQIRAMWLLHFAAAPMADCLTLNTATALSENFW